MINDSSEFTYLKSAESTGKTPKITSIKYIQQFARVYSATKGVEFSGCILN